MAILRLILIAFLIYFILKFVFRLLFPWFFIQDNRNEAFQWKNNKTDRNKENEVILHAPEQEKIIDKDEGEYVDYEDVK